MANEILKVQKLANSSAKAIQKMVNKANEKALKFNADEAKKAREFNSKEAATARTFNANESAISRAFNASEAEKARLFNAEEAEKARVWQKDMSDTAHQREVADLKKAGLNPVLSAGAGATSYTTSSASAGAASSSPGSAGSASAGNASGSVESGASAIGSLMSGMLGAMTGLEQTRMQTDATLRASQIAASASRYVADRNYDAVMDRPQGNPIAVLDKYFGNQASNVISKSVGTLKAGRDYIKNSDGSYSYNPNDAGIQKNLRILGIEPNKLSRNQLNKAAHSVIVCHAEKGSKKADESAKYLKQLSNQNKNRAKTVAKTSPFAGNNWNPYNNGYN